ncbi:MAG: hypothetical protein QS99_C0001G0079 [archaeon GW2011_AR4]|nr:MAG: hypothetical protein QS99_C0001G0079 [archaeon GW2011_AR4]HIH48551.1 hypothetical protein [Candidatus Woesearchaeota archaeon]HIJ02798.1 hypothetical protein [Candidatus Woesearchaeota archaeon]
MGNPMDYLVHLSEGIRIFRRVRRAKKKGFKRYKGNAAQICRQVIDECWNEQFFQTSTGHFCMFWTRDFGWCTDSLLQLGYEKEVIKTLDYALAIFSKYDRVTTAITPSHKPFDFPTYSPDSLAFLLRSLNHADASHLTAKYRDFLNDEIKRFASLVLNKETGLVNRKQFASIKDYSKRQSSCYNNVMLAVLSEEIEKTNLLNPFRKYDYPAMIKGAFWNGEFFRDDLSGKNYVSADANIMPLWTGTITDKTIRKKALVRLHKEGLDDPFPIKYTKVGNETRMLAIERLVEGYEQNTIWMHIGMLYMDILKDTDKELFAEHKKRISALIEKHGTFLEVFSPDGKPFRTPLYLSDEGMLWASLFLAMKEP